MSNYHVPTKEYKQNCRKRAFEQRVTAWHVPGEPLFRIRSHSKPGWYHNVHFSFENLDAEYCTCEAWEFKGYCIHAGAAYLWVMRNVQRLEEKYKKELEIGRINTKEEDQTTLF